MLSVSAYLIGAYLKFCKFSMASETVINVVTLFLMDFFSHPCQAIHM